MTGQRRPQAITRDLRRLRRKGIEVVEGSVEAIDFEHRRVVTAGAELPYDYLVIALGAELAPESIEGLKEQAFGTRPDSAASCTVASYGRRLYGTVSPLGSCSGLCPSG